MYKINLQLLLLAWNILKVCSFSKADVCDTNDENCVHPHVFKPGAIVIDKFPRNNVLLRLQDISLLACMRSCIVTSMCTSVSYKNWHFCDLNGASDYVIADERGCVYTDISTWPNTMGGQCTGHNCKRGTKCIGKHKNGTYRCKIAYCIGYPNVRNAMLVEKFGMYRNVGHAVKYNCKIGFKMTGRPFAVCQRTGIWKTLFGCGSIVSENKPTGFSSFYNKTAYQPSNGVDGNKTKMNYFHTGNETNPYWWVDLKRNYTVVSVLSTNRIDCCGDRLKHLVVYVGSTLNTTEMKECGQFKGPGKNGQIIDIKCNDYPEGNYVKLVNVATDFFSLAEVEVYSEEV